MKSGKSLIGWNNADTQVEYPFVGQGAYVDLGYGYGVIDYPDIAFNSAPPPTPSDFSSSAAPWFFTARALSDVFGNQLAPGFSVYDTWSFHYENDGVNEDN